MQALGMESGAIADSQITASSEWSVNHSSKRARLYTKEIGTLIGGGGAWLSLTSDSNQWLQVDLGKITPVTHVATQGRNSFSPAQMVTKYKLQFSDDGSSFLFYKRQGESSDTVKRNIMTRYSFKNCYSIFKTLITFFTIRTRPKLVNNFFFASLSKYFPTTIAKMKAAVPVAHLFFRSRVCL